VIEPTQGDCWNRIGVAGDRSCPQLAAHVHCRNCGVFEAGGRTLLDREPPAGYLAEWAALLAGDPPIDPLRREAVVIFRAGADWLALPATLLVEVATPRPIRRLPHRTRGILLGLVSIRGEILVCGSLTRLFHLDAPTSGADARHGSEAARLVVARWEGRSWAFPADEVLEVHRIHSSELQDLPETASPTAPRFIRKQLPYQGRSVGLLDPGLLFPALERGTA
jgi:chemotaxis-related protein WspD